MPILSCAADNAVLQAIGAVGSAALLQEVVAQGRPARAGGALRVLTHCNTGSLATAGEGTFHRGYMEWMSRLMSHATTNLFFGEILVFQSCAGAPDWGG